MPTGYVKSFAEKEDLVLTEKLDGQNNCFSKRGVFAKSHAAPTEHPWDRPMRERWELIKNDLNNLEEKIKLTLLIKRKTAKSSN